MVAEKRELEIRLASKSVEIIMRARKRLHPLSMTGREPRRKYPKFCPKLNPSPSKHGPAGVSDRVARCSP